MNTNCTTSACPTTTPLCNTSAHTSEAHCSLIILKPASQRAKIFIHTIARRRTLACPLRSPGPVYLGMQYKAESIVGTVALSSLPDVDETQHVEGPCLGSASYGTKHSKMHISCSAPSRQWVRLPPNRSVLSSSSCEMRSAVVRATASPFTTCVNSQCCARVCAPPPSLPPAAYCRPSHTPHRYHYPHHPTNAPPHQLRSALIPPPSLANTSLANTCSTS